MAFLTTAITSRFPTTNNQLRTSSNPRNQDTIQNGRVTVQQVHGRQGHSFAGMGSKSNTTSLVIIKNGGTNAAVQARVVRCYNCQGEGHMARQCTQPKRPRNLAWFKEKILLTDDLDAFDSDYNEAPGAKVVLMANLSSYDSNVISKVPISETNQDNSVLDNCVQEMYYSKEPAFDPASNIEITSDSNIISYDQYLKETESAAVQNTTSNEQQNVVIMSVFDEITHQVTKCNAESIKNRNVNESLIAELERYKKKVRMFEERQKDDLNNREKLIDSQMNDMILSRNAKFQTKEKEDKYIEEAIDLEKENKELENIVYKVGQSAQTMHMLTKPQVFYDDTHNKALGYQNSFYLKKAQRIKPTLYDGIMISKKHDVIYVVDSEEILILAEESRSKMIAKQNVLILQEEKELSTKQAFWLPISNPISEQLVDQPTSVKIEVPSELPKNKESFQTNRSCSNLDAPTLNESFVINDMKAQLQANESLISNLRAHIATFKGKNVSDTNVPVTNASVIAPGMFRLDLEPLSSKLKNHREAHEDYLKTTKEHTNTLCGIVEQARKLNPSDPYLEYACKFTIRVQELLVFVSETCPSSQVERKKLVSLTPMNRNRKVRFQEPQQSTSTTPTQADSQTTKITNKPLFPSTGKKSSTSDSGSVEGDRES
ncbi:retrovirus-related pol polyprotein from transposon TNT 1-94 [Tanacetum coccineum]